MTAVRKLARTDAHLSTGILERAEPLEVRLDEGTFGARRAKSCLVEPEAGDRVLCAIDDDGVFVLAVLYGRESAPTRLVTEGDLLVEARKGRVGVRSEAGVDISGGEVRVSGRKGTFALEQLSVLGRALRIDVGKAHAVVKDVDTFCGHVMSRAKQVLRFVEELDQTRAGTIDLRAEALLAMRAENAVISARVLAKVNGEQIHLG